MYLSYTSKLDPHEHEWENVLMLLEIIRKKIVCVHPLNEPLEDMESHRKMSPDSLREKLGNCA